MGDVKSHKEKRSLQKVWWAVSLALISLGIVGIIFIPHSRPKGPTLISSLGVVSLPSSGVVIPSPTTATTTTTIEVTPAVSAPTTTTTTTTTIKPASSLAPASPQIQTVAFSSRLAHKKSPPPT